MEGLLVIGSAIAILYIGVKINQKLHAKNKPEQHFPPKEDPGYPPVPVEEGEENESGKRPR